MIENILYVLEDSQGNTEQVTDPNYVLERLANMRDLKLHIYKLSKTLESK